MFIPDQGLDFLPIANLRSRDKKAPDPGSGSATLITCFGILFSYTFDPDSVAMKLSKINYLHSLMGTANYNVVKLHWIQLEMKFDQKFFFMLSTAMFVNCICVYYLLRFVLEPFSYLKYRYILLLFVRLLASLTLCIYLLRSSDWRQSGHSGSRDISRRQPCDK